MNSKRKDQNIVIMTTILSNNGKYIIIKATVMIFVVRSNLVRAVSAPLMSMRVCASVEQEHVEFSVWTNLRIRALRQIELYDQYYSARSVCLTHFLCQAPYGLH